MSIGPRAPPSRGRRAARRPLLDAAVKPPPEAGWSVFDTWPAVVPVTRAEIAVLETFYGPVLDELFGVTAENAGKEAKAPAKPPRKPRKKR